MTLGTVFDNQFLKIDTRNLTKCLTEQACNLLYWFASSSKGFVVLANQ